MEASHVYIKGCGEYFPEKIVSNYDLMESMDTSHEWIYSRTGIKNRRRAKDEELASDMAVLASQEAIENANISLNEIDYILFSITYSEQSFPNTAARLQEKLGIENNCPCLDINAACTGWLYGIELADALITSGKYKNILLVGGEKTSSFLNMHDRNTGILFGDGCGAVVLSATDCDRNNSGIIDIETFCNSKFINELTLENGGIRNPLKVSDFNNPGGPFNLKMNGKRIFKEAVNTMSGLCEEILKRNNFLTSDIKWLVAHQANLRIIEAIGKKLEIDDEKVLLNIEDYGNTSSATIPTTIAKYYKNKMIQRGDLVLMTSFGAGLTASAVLMRF